jgi:hypothetical protein
MPALGLMITPLIMVNQAMSSRTQLPELLHRPDEHQYEIEISRMIELDDLSEDWSVLINKSQHARE